MSYLKLPKRVFNSPLMAYVNFEDCSFINLIKLNKPYANGLSFAVYETTKSPFCSNGLFKTYAEAKIKFDKMVENASKESKILKYGIIDHSKPFPYNHTETTLKN